MTARTPVASIDLSAPEVIADPYPSFAQERARADVAWHEQSGMWLAFSHAAVGAALRDRSLGRIWKDREPTDYLEPFNLLHRNQLMENEPPTHTRLRRLVAGAFNRGHVERLRPRVRALAAQLLDEVDHRSFDVVGQYAEPLPVLVIAELLGVPTSMQADLRRWSQAIVHMYEPSPSQQTVDAAVTAASDFAEYVRELVAERTAEPREDLISDLVAARDGEARLSDDEVVASVVLLLNAGHEATVNAFGNGLVALLRAGVRPDPATMDLCVEEMLRYDAAAQLFERTATRPVEIAGVEIAEGEKIAVLIGAANRDPAVFPDPDVFDPARDPNPHLSFGAGLHFCLGAPLARMELVESVGLLFRRLPDLDLTAPPEHRGTFVLRGHERVWVGAERMQAL